MGFGHPEIMFSAAVGTSECLFFGHLCKKVPLLSILYWQVFYPIAQYKSECHLIISISKSDLLHK